MTTPNSIEWHDGFTAGVISGTLIMVGYFLLGAVDFGDRYHDYANTLIVLVGTLFAAYWALRGLRAQIAQARDAEEAQRQADEARRIGSLRAAASVLPLALSDISVVCVQNIKRHFNPNDLFNDGLPVAQALTTIQPETIQILRECIEFVDDHSHKELAYIIRAYQICLARDAGDLGPLILPQQNDMAAHRRISLVINWATVHSVAGNIFAFARGDLATVPAWDAATVRASLASSGIFLGDYPNLQQVLEAREREGRLRFQFPQDAQQAA